MRATKIVHLRKYGLRNRGAKPFNQLTPSNTHLKNKGTQKQAKRGQKKKPIQKTSNILSKRQKPTRSSSQVARNSTVKLAIKTTNQSKNKDMARLIRASSRLRQSRQMSDRSIQMGKRLKRELKRLGNSLPKGSQKRSLNKRSKSTRKPSPIKAQTTRNVKRQESVKSPRKLRSQKKQNIQIKILKPTNKQTVKTRRRQIRLNRFQYAFPSDKKRIIRRSPIQAQSINNIVVTADLSRSSEGPRSNKQNNLKTLDELSRIKRSRQDRIFLLSAEKTENKWMFQIFGTKSSVYRASIGQSVKCSCFDFRMRQKACKHLYFIITQIAQNDKYLEDIKRNSTIDAKAFRELDGLLIERLRGRMQGVKEEREVDLKDDTDCVICFTEMKKNEQVLSDCQTCKKYFHGECLNQWKNHNNSCPLCRSDFPAQSNDPMSKFQELRI